MRLNKLSVLPFTAAILFFVGCSNNKTEQAINSINAEDLKSYIGVLASDDFTGRAPSTVGEDKTLKYLADEFTKLGLIPGNNGSFFQEVPLLKKSADPNMKLTIKGASGNLEPAFSVDFVGGTPQITEECKFDNSDMIFIGYGIVSDEYGWNDYDGVDVKGKTVVMLVNDPGYATKDTTLFEGNSMTYEGRWTYKFEEAARQGATAAIIIHETGAAAYPWSVVQNSWTSTKMYLAENDLSKSPLILQSWITTDFAQKLFKQAGLNYEEQLLAATKKGFKAVPMNLKAFASIKSKSEYTKSNNIAALLPGNGKSDEILIYSAHWDHFGVNPLFKGDSILNGAVDNATGVAALLEIAKAFTNLPQKLDRSVLFLPFTCEEQGLLGSEYYVSNPLFPLEKTVGVINLDGLNILGKTKDMTLTGLGKSKLDKYALEVLKRNGRYARPDAAPEKGSYFRSDHLNFARKGVQVLYPGNGIDNVEKGEKWGKEQMEKWISENYHKPSDNYDPEKWNFEGMVDDIKIYFQIGYEIITRFQVR